MTFKPELTDVEIKIDTTTYYVNAGWIDESFSHEFGTKYQGFYEVTSVSVGSEVIPLDILDDKFLTMLDSKVNEL